MSPSRAPLWVPRILILLVLTVPLVYAHAYRDYTLPPKLMLLQIGLLATLILLRLFWCRRHDVGPAVGGACIYVLAIGTSVFWSPDPAAALPRVVLPATGLLVLAVTVHALSPRLLLHVVTALATAGALISVLGIVQYVGYRPLAAPSAGLPSATFGFRNIAAMVCVQTLPFAVILAIEGRRRSGILGVVAAALIGGFLIQTRTRGAWLGVLVGLLVVAALVLLKRRDLLHQIRSRRWHLLATVALLGGIALLPPGLGKVGPQSIDEKKSTISQALSSITVGGGDRGRGVMWRHTLRMVSNYPVLGVGAGGWPIHYPAYDRGETVTFSAAPERPHNVFLLNLSETGAAGLITWLALLALALRPGWAALDRRKQHTPWVVLACAWSILAIVTHACFSFPFERVTPTFYFWLTVGLLQVAASDRTRDRAQWIDAALVGSVALTFVSYRWMSFERHAATAVLEETRNDWSGVATATHAALQHGRFHHEMLHLHGFALNQLGRYEEAARFYDDAVVRRPYDIRLLNGSAIALQNGGRHDAAEQRYLRALSIVDDASDLYYNMGGLYVSQERFDDAVAAFEQALELEGPSSDLLFRLGNARALDGQDEAAIRALNRARDIDPGRSDVLFVLAELYFRNQAWDQARGAFRGFLERAPGPSTYARIAQQRLTQIPSP